MRLLFFVKRVSRICVFVINIPPYTPHYRCHKKKKVKTVRLCYQNYIEIISSKLPQKSRVRKKTHLTILTEASTTEKWLFITPTPFLSYF